MILTATGQTTLQKAARSDKRSCLERRRARILLASATRVKATRPTSRPRARATSTRRLVPPSSRPSATSLIQRHRRSCRRWTNSNTRGVASLFAAFPPRGSPPPGPAAGNPPPPKHGSWLNRAEIERLVQRPPVAGRTPGKPGAPCQGDCRLGTHPQHRSHPRQPALHPRRCPPQTQAPLPTNSTLLMD